MFSRLSLLTALAFLVCSFWATVLNTLPIHAQSGGVTFSLSPQQGVVVVGQEFYVDVFLGTNGEVISYARIDLDFDADLLQVTKVEYDSIDGRNGKLFCNFPESEGNFIANNNSGNIVVTGIADGTSTCSYVSTSPGTQAIFARIHFEPQAAGTVELEFNYQGSGSTNSTDIRDNGSPPQRVITQPPVDAEFTIVTTSITPTPTSPDLPPTGFTSVVAIGVSFVMFALSMGLIMFSWYKKRG